MFARRLSPRALRPALARAYATPAAADGGHPGQDPVEYCRELVRKGDYEGYLSHAFYPRTLQPGYLALKAFQVLLHTLYSRRSG
jgi:hypothetical protein